jgi:hypothetical protein
MRSCFLVPLLLIVGCQVKKDETPLPTTKTTSPAKEETAPTTPKDLSGSIMGKDFKPDNVIYEGRKLSFRQGKDFFADMEISFDIPEKDAEKLEGKELKYAGDNFDNPTLHVAAKLKKDDFPKTEFVFPKEYTMTLKITKRTSQTLEGTMDLKISKPQNTHLAGPFVAKVEKAANEAPDEADAPYVTGKVTFVGKWEKESLQAGFVGKGKDGKHYSNMAGTNVTPNGKEWVTSTTFKPQITSMFNSKESPGFKHVKMAPGDYIVYVKRSGVAAAWKKATVKEKDQLTVDLTIDPTKTGSVVVTLSDAEAKDSFEDNLALIPGEFDKKDIWLRNEFRAADVKKDTKTVTIKGVPAGKYTVLRGQSEAEVEVIAGKETAVTLNRAEPKK